MDSIPNLVAELVRLKINVLVVGPLTASGSEEEKLQMLSKIRLRMFKHRVSDERNRARLADRCLPLMGVSVVVWFQGCVLVKTVALPQGGSRG